MYNNMLETDKQRRLWLSMKKTAVWIATGSHSNGRFTNDSKKLVKEFILDLSKRIDLSSFSNKELNKIGHEIMCGARRNYVPDIIYENVDNNFHAHLTKDPRYIRVYKE